MAWNALKWWQRKQVLVLTVDKGVLNSPILWRNPYIAQPPRFKFCPPPPPSPLPSTPPPPAPSLLPATPTATAHSVVLFLWLNGWSHYIWCAILLNIMDARLSRLTSWCMFYVLCNMTSSFIVCIGVSTPLSKTLTPLFYQAPPQIYKCPSSAFFMKFPPIY